MQSPYGAFLFASGLNQVGGYEVTYPLQSPYGAFLFARTPFVDRRILIYPSVAIPLRGFSFCKYTRLNVQRRAIDRGCNPLTGLFFLQDYPMGAASATGLRGPGWNRDSHRFDKRISNIVKY